MKEIGKCTPFGHPPCGHNELMPCDACANSYWTAVSDTLNAIEAHGLTVDDLWNYLRPDRRIAKKERGDEHCCDKEFQSGFEQGLARGAAIATEAAERGA